MTGDRSTWTYQNEMCGEEFVLDNFNATLLILLLSFLRRADVTLCWVSPVSPFNLSGEEEIISTISWRAGENCGKLSVSPCGCSEGCPLWKILFKFGEFSLDCYSKWKNAWLQTMVIGNQFTQPMTLLLSLMPGRRCITPCTSCSWVHSCVWRKQGKDMDPNISAIIKWLALLNNIR